MTHRHTHQKGNGEQQGQRKEQDLHRRQKRTIRKIREGNTERKARQGREGDRGEDERRKKEGQGKTETT